MLDTVMAGKAIKGMVAFYSVRDAYRKGYLKRRNYRHSEFTDIGLPCPMPKGAFYLFPDISPTGLTSKDFALKLLESEKVAVVPGNVFGECGKNHIRCSYATSLENIKEAVKRIKHFVQG